ncbi:hypothetical protein [Dactylosporangium sp. CS-033363]|uniref:hypothetical protein n=1 Tax=Dactylosporangium sp. CS-033363 TaxID=3239935 RepID=UPI003D91746F
MSFSLLVLAARPGASDAEVRAMAGACLGPGHREGELDERIVSFYESLRGRFPDFLPYGADTPWMDTPLAVGIDHVGMQLSFSDRSRAALELIDQLARRYRLHIYDPQGDELKRPEDASVSW